MLVVIVMRMCVGVNMIMSMIMFMFMDMIFPMAVSMIRAMNFKSVRIAATAGFTHSWLL
jgi:hypothetical protein